MKKAVLITFDRFVYNLYELDPNIQLKKNDEILVRLQDGTEQSALVITPPKTFEELNVDEELEKIQILQCLTNSVHFEENPLFAFQKKVIEDDQNNSNIDNYVITNTEKSQDFVYIKPTLTGEETEEQLNIIDRQVELTNNKLSRDKEHIQLINDLENKRLSLRQNRLANEDFTESQEELDIVTEARELCNNKTKFNEEYINNINSLNEEITQLKASLIQEEVQPIETTIGTVVNEELETSNEVDFVEVEEILEPVENTGVEENKEQITDTLSAFSTFEKPSIIDEQVNSTYKFEDKEITDNKSKKLVSEMNKKYQAKLSADQDYLEKLDRIEMKRKQLEVDRINKLSSKKKDPSVESKKELKVRKEADKLIAQKNKTNADYDKAQYALETKLTALATPKKENAVKESNVEKVKIEKPAKKDKSDKKETETIEKTTEEVKITESIEEVTSNELEWLSPIVNTEVIQESVYNKPEITSFESKKELDLISSLEQNEADKKEKDQKHLVLIANLEKDREKLEQKRVLKNARKQKSNKSYSLPSESSAEKSLRKEAIKVSKQKTAYNEAYVQKHNKLELARVKAQEARIKKDGKNPEKTQQIVEQQQVSDLQLDINSLKLSSPIENQEVKVDFAFRVSLLSGKESKKEMALINKQSALLEEKRNKDEKHLIALEKLEEERLELEITRIQGEFAKNPSEDFTPGPEGKKELSIRKQADALINEKSKFNSTIVDSINKLEEDRIKLLAAREEKQSAKPVKEVKPKKEAKQKEMTSSEEQVPQITRAAVISSSLFTTKLDFDLKDISKASSPEEEQVISAQNEYLAQFEQNNNDYQAVVSDFESKRLELENQRINNPELSNDVESEEELNCRESAIKFDEEYTSTQRDLLTMISNLEEERLALNNNINSSITEEEVTEEEVTETFVQANTSSINVLQDQYSPITNLETLYHPKEPIARFTGLESKKEVAIIKQQFKAKFDKQKQDYDHISAINKLEHDRVLALQSRIDAEKIKSNSDKFTPGPESKVEVAFRTKAVTLCDKKTTINNAYAELMNDLETKRYVEETARIEANYQKILKQATKIAKKNKTEIPEIDREPRSEIASYSVLSPIVSQEQPIDYLFNRVDLTGEETKKELAIIKKQVALSEAKLAKDNEFSNALFTLEQKRKDAEFTRITLELSKYSGSEFTPTTEESKVELVSREQALQFSNEKNAYNANYINEQHKLELERLLAKDERVEAINAVNKKKAEKLAKKNKDSVDNYYEELINDELYKIAIYEQLVNNEVTAEVQTVVAPTTVVEEQPVIETVSEQSVQVTDDVASDEEINDIVSEQTLPSELESEEFIESSQELEVQSETSEYEEEEKIVEEAVEEYEDTEETVEPGLTERELTDQSSFDNVLEQEYTSFENDTLEETTDEEIADIIAEETVVVDSVVEEIEHQEQLLEYSSVEEEYIEEDTDAAIEDLYNTAIIAQETVKDEPGEVLYEIDTKPEEFNAQLTELFISMNILPNMLFNQLSQVANDEKLYNMIKDSANNTFADIDEIFEQYQNITVQEPVTKPVEEVVAEQPLVFEEEETLDESNLLQTQHLDISSLEKEEKEEVVAQEEYHEESIYTFEEVTEEQLDIMEDDSLLSASNLDISSLHAKEVEAEKVNLEDFKEQSLYNINIVEEIKTDDESKSNTELNTTSLDFSSSDLISDSLVPNETVNIQSDDVTLKETKLYAHPMYKKSTTVDTHTDNHSAQQFNSEVEENSATSDNSGYQDLEKAAREELNSDVKDSIEFSLGKLVDGEEVEEIPVEKDENTFDIQYGESPTEQHEEHNDEDEELEEFEMEDDESDTRDLFLFQEAEREREENNSGLEFIEIEPDHTKFLREDEKFAQTTTNEYVEKVAKETEKILKEVITEVEETVVQDEQEYQEVYFEEDEVVIEEKPKPTFNIDDFIEKGEEEDNSHILEQQRAEEQKSNSMELELDFAINDDIETEETTEQPIKSDDKFYSHPLNSSEYVEEEYVDEGLVDTPTKAYMNEPSMKNVFVDELFDDEIELDNDTPAKPRESSEFTVDESSLEDYLQKTSSETNTISHEEDNTSDLYQNREVEPTSPDYLLDNNDLLDSNLTSTSDYASSTEDDKETNIYQDREVEPTSNDYLINEENIEQDSVLGDYYDEKPISSEDYVHTLYEANKTIEPTDNNLLSDMDLTDESLHREDEVDLASIETKETNIYSQQDNEGTSDSLQRNVEIDSLIFDKKDDVATIDSSEDNFSDDFDSNSQFESSTEDKLEEPNTSDMFTSTQDEDSTTESSNVEFDEFDDYEEQPLYDSNEANPFNTPVEQYTSDIQETTEEPFTQYLENENSEEIEEFEEQPVYEQEEVKSFNTPVEKYASEIEETIGGYEQTFNSASESANSFAEVKEFEEQPVYEQEEVKSFDVPVEKYASEIEETIGGYENTLFEVTERSQEIKEAVEEPVYEQEEIKSFNTPQEEYTSVIEETVEEVQVISDDEIETIETFDDFEEQPVYQQEEIKSFNVSADEYTSTIEETHDNFNDDDLDLSSFDLDDSEEATDGQEQNVYNQNIKGFDSTKEDYTSENIDESSSVGIDMTSINDDINNDSRNESVQQPETHAYNQSINGNQSTSTPITDERYLVPKEVSPTDYSAYSHIKPKKVLVDDDAPKQKIDFTSLNAKQEHMTEQEINAHIQSIDQNATEDVLINVMADPYVEDKGQSPMSHIDDQYRFISSKEGYVTDKYDIQISTEEYVEPVEPQEFDVKEFDIHGKEKEGEVDPFDLIDHKDNENIALIEYHTNLQKQKANKYTLRYATDIREYYDVDGKQVHRKEFIEISTAEEFFKIKEDLNGSYMLTKDISLADNSLLPIGLFNEFKGVLEGNNCNIYGFSRKDTIYMHTHCGLFGRNRGIIRNLNLIDFDISIETENYLFAGILVGENLGKIHNVTTDGTLYTKSNSKFVNSGSITGQNFGTITNCSSTARIIVGSTENRVGGIVGDNYGIIETSYTNCKVKAIGPTFAGGIAGINYNKINESYSNTKLSVDSKEHVIAGGLVGYHKSGEVTNSLVKPIIEVEAKTAEVGNAVARYEEDTFENLFYLRSSIDTTNVSKLYTPAKIKNLKSVGVKKLQQEKFIVDTIGWNLNTWNIIQEYPSLKSNIIKD